jgi:hypothetical protein
MRKKRLPDESKTGKTAAKRTQTTLSIGTKASPEKNGKGTLAA